MSRLPKKHRKACRAVSRCGERYRSRRANTVRARACRASATVSSHHRSGETTKLRSYCHGIAWPTRTCRDRARKRDRQGADAQHNSSSCRSAENRSAGFSQGLVKPSGISLSRLRCGHQAILQKQAVRPHQRLPRLGPGHFRPRAAHPRCQWAHRRSSLPTRRHSRYMKNVFFCLGPVPRARFLAIMIIEFLRFTCGVGVNRPASIVHGSNVRCIARICA
jgi:hypothetical protein